MKIHLLALVLAGCMLSGCFSIEHDRLATQREQYKSAAQIAGADSAARVAGANADVAQANANKDMYQTLADAAGQTGRILGFVLFGLLVIMGGVLYCGFKYYMFKFQTAAEERKILLSVASSHAAREMYLADYGVGLPATNWPQVARGEMKLLNDQLAPPHNPDPSVPPAIAARARKIPGAVPIWHPDRGWLIVDGASGKVLVSCRKVIA